MVRESVNLLELLRRQAAGGDLDFLRQAVALLAEAVMEAEVAAPRPGGTPSGGGHTRRRVTPSAARRRRSRAPGGGAAWSGAGR